MNTGIKLLAPRHEDGEVARTSMEVIMTQNYLNWFLLGILLLWIMVFTVLALRPAKNGQLEAEDQALDSINVEPQTRKTQPQLVAVQHEMRRYRPHNTGEVEAITV
jgi:hypothetical protein